MPERGGSARVQWAGGVVASLALLAFLSFVGGARLEAPTYALVVVAASLMFVLAQLYRMVVALARPDADVAVEGRGLASAVTQSELREDRKRVLKAIKELDFDHEMGKISDADHKAVRERYQLRAVEVMRALEDQPRLHPRVQDLLSRSTGVEEESPLVTPLIATKAGCLSCGAANDPDANFCKGCGAKLS